MTPKLPWMLVNLFALTIAGTAITVALRMEPVATIVGLAVLIGILVYTLGDRRSR